jgi:hypothetical protein
MSPVVTAWFLHLVMATTTQSVTIMDISLTILHLDASLLIELNNLSNDTPTRLISINLLTSLN